MNLSIIPKDSLFQQWLTIGSMLETPNSFLLGVAMWGLGVLLRRSVWVDLGKAGKVYPNLSVLLVGPAGLGKDTAINIASNQIVMPFAEQLDITGNTIESIVDQLHDLQKIYAHNPACGFILAPELTALFGGKEYQKGIASRLTDLLSTGPRFSDGTKGEGKKVIINPTVSLVGGTTEEWLHKNMPENALEGGLIPRVLVIAEDHGKRMVPRPNNEMTYEEKKAIDDADIQLTEGLKRILATYNTPRELSFTEEAGFAHDNWYCNRYSMFSNFVQPYAHRSRAQISRMAMLSAVSRCGAFIELADVDFAIEIMNMVAASIDKAILPPNLEYKVAKQIKAVLPATTATILVKLSPKYESMLILKALVMLKTSQQVVEKQGVMSVV